MEKRFHAGYFLYRKRKWRFAVGRFARTNRGLLEVILGYDRCVGSTTSSRDDEPCRLSIADGSFIRVFENLFGFPKKITNDFIFVLSLLLRVLKGLKGVLDVL